MQKEKPDHPDLSKLKEQLCTLEQRIIHIEKSLSQIKSSGTRTSTIEQNQPEPGFEVSFPFKSKGSIEFGIGEYGMAWLGNIVLLVAVVFFVQQLHNSVNPRLSILVGFAAVAGIYSISFFTRKTYLYLSNLFRYNGHLLLFYLTLRLHFVQNSVIENLTLGLIATVAVLGVLFYLAFRKQSQLLMGIVLLMMLITGIVSNSTHFLLGISTFTAASAVIFYYRFGWIRLVIAFIFFIYLAQLIWLLNNPVVTHVAEFRENHEFCYIYFIATGFIFSHLAILPKKEKVSNEILIFALIWNGLGFTSLLIITVFTYLNENYVLIFSLISLFSLIYSIMIYSRSFLKISASIYAIYGFIAMSVAIYGIFLFPRAYTLFAIQSFLVVSMALWFRSQFIVVMNTLLFLLLLVFYIKAPVSYNSANFSFMLVSFITARVINWKKERLNLKTELIRNLYLISGFVMTLIAFYHAVPDSLVTVSWIFAAILFFVFGYLMQNIKYRWLAIAAVIASAINILVVDMSSMDASARIVIFMLLAIISIAVSVVYTKYLANKNE